MGTVWEMAVWSRERPRALWALDGAFQEVARLERLMSRFLPESQVSQLARAAGQATVPIDPDLYTLLAQAQQVAAVSDGAFDVTMGPLVALWARADLTGVLPGPAEIRFAKSLVDYRASVLDADGPTAVLQHAGMSLDLGAIGKGFAVDRAVERLQAAGYTQGWVNAGGNVRFLGSWDRAVPVRDPKYPDRAFVRLIVEEGALATSANYERGWKISGQRYGHLLDPRTGWPADSGCLSVTVCAPTAALADALSTACFVLGPERSWLLCAVFPKVEALWYMKDNNADQMQLVITPGINGRVHDLPALQEEPIHADVSLA